MSSSSSSPTWAIGKHGKCRSAVDYLKERWRSDVLHQTSHRSLQHSQEAPDCIVSTSPMRKKMPVRRCLSQPVDRIPSMNNDRCPYGDATVTMKYLAGHRDVGVQCSLIEWNPVVIPVESVAGSQSSSIDSSSSTPTAAIIATESVVDSGERRRLLYGFGVVPSWSQETSLVATDGSGSTTLGGSDECVGGEHNDEELAFRRWYMTASTAFVNRVPASPPPASSRSLGGPGCIASSDDFDGGCVPTRAQRLRREFRGCRGTSSAMRSASCHVEPELVHCCSASAAFAMSESRVDVSAWRRQFRRRKAITTSDNDVDEDQVMLWDSNGNRSGRSFSSWYRKSGALPAPSEETGRIGNRSCSIQSSATQLRSVRQTCKLKKQ